MTDRVALVRAWLDGYRGRTFRDGGQTAAVVKLLDGLQSACNQIAVGEESFKSEACELFRCVLEMEGAWMPPQEKKP